MNVSTGLGLFGTRLRISGFARFVDLRRKMYRVSVVEVLRPKRPSPLICEVLRKSFGCEPSPGRRGFCIDYLQMAQFVEEHFVKEETPHSEARPPLATSRSESVR
jgi:hypothetical protein